MSEPTGSPEQVEELGDRELVVIGPPGEECPPCAVLEEALARLGPEVRRRFIGINSPEAREYLGDAGEVPVPVTLVCGSEECRAYEVLYDGKNLVLKRDEDTGTRFIPLLEEEVYMAKCVTCGGPLDEHGCCPKCVTCPLGEPEGDAPPGPGTGNP